MVKTEKKYLHVPDKCFFTFFVWRTICIEPEETAKILQCYRWFPCEVWGTSAEIPY